MRTSSSLASRTISATSVASSKATRMIATLSSGRKVSLPRGSSDAALAPYHVERSKLFVLDRVAPIEELDGERIARAIGFTRFPYSSWNDETDIDEEGALLRSADLIGQLGESPLLEESQCALPRI